MVNNDYVGKRESSPQVMKPIMWKDNLPKTKTVDLEVINQDVNHTEEVIIGTEQGTTFPTKIGTLMCNALIDTGATRSLLVKNIIKTYHQQKSAT